MGAIHDRVEQVARWWQAASEEERFVLLRQAIEGRNPKGPTLEEVQLGALIAEATAGEVDGEEARAAGQRLGRG